MFRAGQAMGAAADDLRARWLALRGAAAAIAALVAAVLTATAAGARTADLTTPMVAPATAVARGSLTSTMFVTNNGPDAATNVVLTAHTPSGTGSVSQTAPAGWTCASLAGGTVDAGAPAARAMSDGAGSGPPRPDVVSDSRNRRAGEHWVLSLVQHQERKPRISIADA
jgi:uncharacterized repeat protein (TIGR01451 family)